MLEDAETADHSNPPKRKTIDRHTHLGITSFLYKVYKLFKRQLKVLFRRKLPFISAYNHLAANKRVSREHKRAGKIPDRHYSQNQNGKMAKSTYGLKSMDNHNCSCIVIFKHKNEQADVISLKKERKKLARKKIL